MPDRRSELRQPDLVKQLRERVCVGLFAEMPHPATVELAALAGWDFVVADCEHGALGTTLLVDMLRAGQAASIPVIVRVARNDHALIQQALDNGAAGVQVPQLADLEEARRALAAARFYPDGMRGVNPFVRAAAYGKTPAEEFFRHGRKEVAVVLQIENRQALADAEAIAALEGVTALFAGPYDLSQSLGVPGETSHPKVVDAIQQMIAACLRRNVAAGVFAGSEEAARMWARRGVRFLCYSLDVVLYRRALEDTIQRVREALQGI